MDPDFSEKNLNTSVNEDYKHNVVTIEPSEMELEKAEEARKAALAEEEAAKEKARKEAEKLKRKGSASKASKEDLHEEEKGQEGAEGEGESKKGSEKDEAEEVDDEDDEYHYRVYFRKEEIRYAMSQQETDQFEDLLLMKTVATQENIENVGTTNKFNIMDFQPSMSSMPLIMKGKSK